MNPFSASPCRNAHCLSDLFAGITNSFCEYQIRFTNFFLPAHLTLNARPYFPLLCGFLASALFPIFFIYPFFPFLPYVYLPFPTACFLSLYLLFLSSRIFSLLSVIYSLFFVSGGRRWIRTTDLTIISREL